MQLLAQFGLRLVGKRVGMLEQLGDGQAAHLFVVLFVAGHREEATPHGVFLVCFVGLDEGFGEDGRCGCVEDRQ